MRFLDSNIFIYAYYRPSRALRDREMVMKEASKRILKAVNEGEEKVLTTVVHLSEVANILGRRIGLSELTDLFLGLFMLDNVAIEDVSRDLYFSAIDLGQELGLDPNDALAVEAMRRNEIDEIYSFDADFDKVKGIKRITSK
jgi:hypothetical protein